MVEKQKKTKKKKKQNKKAWKIDTQLIKTGLKT